MLGTQYAIVYTKRMGEQTIDIQGGDRKKRGGSGHRAAAMNGEIMIQDQGAKAAVTWAMVERVKSCFTDT